MKRLAFVALAVALFGIVFVFHHHSRSPAIEPTDPEDLAVRRVVEAAMERIAADSRGARDEPAVLSAPLPSGGNRPGKPVPDPAPLVAPNGYSTVEHHGEMAKGEIRTRRIRSGPTTAGRREWLTSANAIDTLVRQAANADRDWTFGWIRLAHDSRPDDLARELAGTGAEILGSAGALFRVRLPGDAAALRHIDALPTVDGLGSPPTEAKMSGWHDDLVDWAARDDAPVFITLMDDDPDGRWRKSLEDLGAVVGRFDSDTRAYTANVSRALLDELADADFVLAVEPVGVVRPVHDVAVPAMGADALRTYSGTPGVFSGTGGSGVPIAVMDTGLNTNHADIATHRTSICGVNFISSDPLEADDLWIDIQLHGTHVTGTIAGNGFAEQRFAGMAPGVQHIRFAKVFGAYGYEGTDTVGRAMNYFAESSGCGEDGPQAKPMLVNMSLAAVRRTFAGRDNSSRKLDATVWNHRQLYVVAAANSSIHGYSNYAASKNSLAVGAATKSGPLASFSSHGPLIDGRLMPNLVATGVDIISPAGNGSRGEYVTFSGTSMSSPTVAGIASLLLDAVPDYQWQPALTRARLMASAVRPDAWLEDAVGFPSTNTDGPGTIQAAFGMGTTSARTAVLHRDEPDGWTSGSATAELRDGEYAYHDIVVPEGSSRLDLVLTWDELAAETIDDTVLNDLDLWLDRDGDCVEEACGEYVSSSRIDNVEWIIVRNPEPGTYRAKILARRVYNLVPRAGLAWTVIRGPSTPKLVLDADRTVVGEGRSRVDLTLNADGYVSNGTRLHIDCRGPEDCSDVTVDSIEVQREDGIALDQTGHAGRSVLPVVPVRPGLDGVITIGEVAVGESQEITVRIFHGPSSNARLHFKATAWNARAGSVHVDLGDGDHVAVDTPANDDFASAATLMGEAGIVELDLLKATPEPGESQYLRSGLPSGSVWYDWTAPFSGPLHLGITSPGLDPLAREIGVIDVFRGSHVATLATVASGRNGTTLFVEEGLLYRIRVAGHARGLNLELAWSPGMPPANDDFARATRLEGDSGTVQGSTQGATLEDGESFGSTTATTWFRWIAPDDGAWRFSVSGLGMVMVFEGDSVRTLRLVSGSPAYFASFPAGRDREYRIAVAEWNAHRSGGPFELRWSTDPGAFGNDNVANAELVDATGSGRSFTIDGTPTVQPGEPVESGVRTLWWAWDAPEDGRFTWRIEEDQRFGYATAFRLAAFSGSAEELEVMDVAGPNANTAEVVVEAVGGERRWVSVGFGMGDIAAYNTAFATGALRWGWTPGNDRVANAVGLSGVSGSVTGNNRHATTEPGLRMTEIGRSAVWWTFEAPESGWYRFSATGQGDARFVLTVHREGDAGGLAMIASSRWQEFGSTGDEVLFYADAATRYTIALGVDGAGFGNEFAMEWEPTEAPLWLEFANRFESGDRDSAGNLFEFRDPGRMVFRDDSDILYVASSVGLHALESDRETGDLSFLQLLDGDFRSHVLFWDAQRDRLIANDCSDWRAFETIEGESRLGEAVELPVADDSGNCGNHMFMDPEGVFLYRSGGGYVESYAVNDGGGLRLLDSLALDEVRRAARSIDGDHVYAAGGDQLHVLERDSSSGTLTALRSEPLAWPVLEVAITPDGQHLFVIEDGRTITVFSLEDPSMPRKLDSLPAFWPSSFSGFFDICLRASARPNAVAVDAFCWGKAVSARLDPDLNILEGTEYVGGGGADRFNNPVPDSGVPRGLAASPNGLHLYVTVDQPRPGILQFTRIGSRAPDVVVETTVDKHVVAPKESFRLEAVVLNTGTIASESTTLRFYISPDAEISTTDVEIRATGIDEIGVDASISHSIFVNAERVAGHYYYGACVDESPIESDVANNCSAAVGVGVRPDIDERH